MPSQFVSLLIQFKTLLKGLSHSSLGLVLLPIIALVLIGTFGYAWLEGWTLFEALYVTIITITTVGYGDFSPQTAGGRIFAVFFTLSAIGLAGYAISTLAAVVIDYETTRVAKAIEERRMKRLADLHNHIIICGGTVVGHRVATEFVRRQETFVIIEADETVLKKALLWIHEGYIQKRMRQFNQLDNIDIDEERKSVAELADEIGVLYLLEDPTSEQQMLRAGLERAKGIVAALNDDRDNVAIVLSARHIARQLGNKKLRIVARALEEENMRRLYLAGADKVTAPNFVGGYHLASAMLSPEMGDFWDHMLYQNDQRMRFADLQVANHPGLVGQSVATLKQSQAELVVAIKRDDSYLYAPDADEVFQGNDVLIVMGPM